jgi:hypothetical protein
VEYFMRTGDYNADVKLFPVVLTIDQVRSYRLPRTPIKDSERRATSFQDRYGAGAVELDALEALYPGVLERVLTGELERYYDQGLERKVRRAERRLRQDLDATRQAIVAEHQAEIDSLRSEYTEIRSEFDARMGSYANRLQTLWQAISAELEAQTPDLDDYPIPAASPASEKDGALYDSERGYLQQIDCYKEFQGKE